MENIPTSEQWRLEGKCYKCRRANYCNKDCSVIKKRKTKIAQQAYFDLMEKMEHERQSYLEEHPELKNHI